MTHLVIQQKSIQEGGQREIVSSKAIKLLYDAAKDQNLVYQSTDLKGDLSVDKTYLIYADYLTTRYPGLSISANGWYIKFEDSVVELKFAITYGDNTGITLTEALALISSNKSSNLLSNLFRDDTTITEFNELKYFTGITVLGQNSFRGCTSLESIDLTNITEIGNNVFNGCLSLSTVLHSLCSAIGDGAFENCTSLTQIPCDTNNLTSVGENAFRGCENMGQGGTLELNLTQQIGFPHRAFAKTLYNRLILHWTNALTNLFDTRYRIWAQMENLTYLDVSDTIWPYSAFTSNIVDFGGFYQNSSIHTVILPVNVDYLSVSSVKDIKGTCRYFIVLNTTPPQLETTDANNPPSTWLSNSQMHIYVPDSVKATYLANSNWSLLGGDQGSVTISDRLHGLSELPAGIWTTGLASQYLTLAQLATS